MVMRRLLKRLGLGSDSSPRKYALDVSLHPMLESLAEEQQRSPDEVVSEIVSSALASDELDADMWRRWQSLSPREQQIAALTCLGYTNPQIAARLRLAVETVRTHTRNVQIKFNVNSKADLRLLLSAWDFRDFDQM